MPTDTYREMDGVTVTLIDVPVYLPSEKAEVFPGTPIGVLRKGVEFIIGNEFPEFVLAEVTFPAAPPPAITYDKSRPQAPSFIADSLFVQLPKRSIPGKYKIRSGATLQTGFFRTLTLGPHGPAFSHVRCQPLLRLGGTATNAQVAAQFAIGELWGWADLTSQSSARTQLQRGWDKGCRRIMTSGAPGNYSRPRPLGFDLVERMRSGDNFYIADVRNAERLKKCWRVQVTERPPATGLYLLHFDEHDAPLSYESIAIEGSSLLRQPFGYSAGRAELYGRSGGTYRLQVVRADDDSLGLLPVNLPSDRRDGELSMFDPYAIHWWDRSLERCEERLQSLSLPRE